MSVTCLMEHSKPPRKGCGEVPQTGLSDSARETGVTPAARQLSRIAKILHKPKADSSA